MISQSVSKSDRWVIEVRSLGYNVAGVVSFMEAIAVRHKPLRSFVPVRLIIYL